MCLLGVHPMSGHSCASDRQQVVFRPIILLGSGSHGQIHRDLDPKLTLSQGWPFPDRDHLSAQWHEHV